jgi:hypothetical protein
MPEALLCRDSDWGRQEHSNKYDDYFHGSHAPRSHRWKTPPKCGPEWKDKLGLALEANPFLEERSQQEVLNATIDKIYDELSELVVRRSSQPDPTLEKQITSFFQRLRELQKQEGDLVREYTKAKLAGPIAAGLDILKHADQIRARYGIATVADTATPDPNISKT